MSDLLLTQCAFNLAAGVLGASGHGMGVWVAGCSIGCPGCTSQHTWDAKTGIRTSAAALVQLAQRQPQTPKRLTVSGGEPTQQSIEVLTFITAFRATFPRAEVVLYTGLRWPVFVNRHANLAAVLDVVVAGPYVQTLAASPLAGSSNQSVHLLTPLAELLYAGWQNWPMHAIQAATAQNKLVTVGIPPNEAAMTRAAEKIGAIAVSWHPNQPDAANPKGQE